MFMAQNQIVLTGLTLTGVVLEYMTIEVRNGFLVNFTYTRAVIH